ncbi:MAG: MFS transporter [Verrucomicrobiota bacterium]
MTTDLSTLTPLERRNFWLHVLEGGFYMGGIAFLSAEVVLPEMVDTLGGKPWLIAYMPTLMLIGFFLPSLVVVPLINRLHRFKPVIVLTGVLQRLPFLVAAAFLWFFADDFPRWTLFVVVAAPLVSGLLGGLTINAWLEMITRMIPEQARASGWAFRFIIASVIGIIAGPIIHRILEIQPGPPGYAVLHLITFIFLAISMVFFCFLKETHFPVPLPPNKRPSYFAELADIPRKAKRAPYFVRYLLVRFTGIGYAVLAPFLAIHALQITGRPEADLGYFVTAEMIGAVAGNLVAARLGDRHGGKIVLILSRTVLITVSLLVIVTASFPGFLVAFFLFGFTLFADRVGDLTLGVDLAPPRNRADFLAIMTFILVPAMIMAAQLSSTIENVSGTLGAAAIATIAVALTSLAILLTIPEPRKTNNLNAPNQ